MMKAHPTTYNGVNFRSRLEAKWAAFFDLLGWKWQYEPVDLDGWCPDFSISGHDGPIYVEVKPIEWSGSADGMIRYCMDRQDLAKVRAYRGDRNVLILGTAPAMLTVSDYDWMAHLGVIIDPKFGSDYSLDVANIWLSQSGAYDFAANYGSFQFRIDGVWAGDGHLFEVSKDALTALWRNACNSVQWKAA